MGAPRGPGSGRGGLTISTYWHQPEGGVLPPGIYCEDEATFKALKRQADDRIAPELQACQAGRAVAHLDAMSVFIATPLQAEALRALATTQDGAAAKSASIEAARIERLQEMAKSYDMSMSWAATVQRAAARQALREAARAMPRPRPRQEGLNRRARRAAAAMARRA